MGICASGVATSAPMNPYNYDLSRYEIGITLGKGGFGKVHHVLDRDSELCYALKRMGKQIILDRNSQKYVWRERNILRDIAEANCNFLCSAVRSFQSDSEVFIVLNLLEGGDFHYQLAQQPRHRFSERKAKFYMCEMLCGLQELHSLNYLYRDLKLQNMLLDAKGHIKFSDFGLTIMVKPEKGNLVSHRVGTPGYQAPEVMQGHPYGFASDIYSLGIALYELVHGYLPVHYSVFSGISKEEAKDRELYTYKLRTSISDELQNLIVQLLEVNPRRRIGCEDSSVSGIETIMEHVWFEGVDWDKVSNRDIEAPIIPDTNRANTDMEAEANDQLIDEKPKPININDEHFFEGFEWNDFVAEMPQEVKDKRAAEQAERKKRDDKKREKELVALEKRKAAKEKERAKKKARGEKARQRRKNNNLKLIEQKQAQQKQKENAEKKQKQNIEKDQNSEKTNENQENPDQKNSKHVRRHTIYREVHQRKDSALTNPLPSPTDVKLTPPFGDDLMAESEEELDESESSDGNGRCRDRDRDVKIQPDKKSDPAEAMSPKATVRSTQFGSEILSDNENNSIGSRNSRRGSRNTNVQDRKMRRSQRNPRNVSRSHNNSGSCSQNSAGEYEAEQ